MSSPTSPQSTTNSVTYIHYNGAYIHTVAGFLKLACIVVNLVGFICIQASSFSYHRWGSFFSSVSMTGFWFTGILLVLYLFQVTYKVSRVPWLKIELYFCIGMTLFYMLVSSLAAWMGWAGYVAAAFFGYVAMILYGYDAFLKYKEWNENTIVVKIPAPVQVTVA